MDKLLQNAPLTSVKKAVVLLRPDEVVDKVFYLKEGYVKMYVISKQGVETTIHIFKPTSYFPMISILADSKNQYYLETITQVELYIIKKSELLLFLREYPEELQKLTERLLKGMEKLTKRIQLLSTASAKMKVVSALTYLARHFGREENSEIVIQETFTHQDIAALSGLTRETTSREWKKLENEKFVSYKNKRIHILKKELVKDSLD